MQPGKEIQVAKNTLVTEFARSPHVFVELPVVALLFVHQHWWQWCGAAEMALIEDVFDGVVVAAVGCDRRQ